MHVIIFLLYSMVTLLLSFQSTVYGENLKFCPGGRIRGLEQLSKIKECDVIEGNLILAFKFVDSKDEWKSNALKVREITGYVILYFVGNLPSLDLILPNLRVIRGNTLFSNYALIIFGLWDLETISLNNLSAILRGSVRIEGNVALTDYVNTVDWNNITSWNNGSHFTHSNFIQPPVEGHVAICPKKCRFNENENGLCWSSTVCQRGCPKSRYPLSCSALGEPCPVECVGGCYKRNNRIRCYACRNFKYLHGCSDACFPHYEFENYRCISDEQCASMTSRKLLRLNETKRMCVKHCPPSYEHKVDTNHGFHSCVPCQGCLKVCNGGSIDSVGIAQRFSGCTRINGSLEIRVFGSKVMDELITHLGQIQEVEGYVHVFKSKELQSLQFFANLSVIHGEELWQNNYSLIVHDNDNLQELWNTTSLKLNVKKGRVMFYANPKLCSLNIETLIGEGLWKASVPDEQIRRILNGNKRACNVDLKFEFSIEPTDSKGTLKISFKINQLQLDIKTTELVGCYVYYQATEEENLDYFSDRQWSRVFQAYNPDTRTYLNIELDNLKPATKYAIYLEVLMTNSLQNFHSKIEYATTQPFNPSVPEGVEVSARGKDYIEVTWKPPAFPNGKIDHYILTVSPRSFRNENMNLDICNDEVRKSVSASIEKRKDRKESDAAAKKTGPPSTTTAKTCPCSSKEFEGEKAEEIKLQHINVALKLAKLLYIKEPPTERRKRHLIDASLLDENCGKLDTLGTRHKRRVRPGGLSRVLRYPSNDTEPLLRPPNTNINSRDLNRLKMRLLSHAKNLSLHSLIPYLKKPSMSNRCIQYLLYLTEQLTAAKEELQQRYIPQKIQNCSAILTESQKPQFCHHVPSATENIVYERRFRITNLTAPLYEVKIKACHKPNPTVVCETKDQVPCKLCSLWYGSKIVHDEKDFRVRNVTVIEVRGENVKVAWTPPLFSNWGEILGYDIYTHEVTNASVVNRITEQSRSCRNTSVNETWLTISNPGNYSVTVSAFSQINGGLRQSPPDYFVIKDKLEVKKGSKDFLIILAFIFIIFIIGVYVYLKMSKNKNKIIDKMETAVNLEYEASKELKESRLPPWKEHLEANIDPKFIHSRKSLSIMGLMDEGRFGVVSRGTLRVSNSVIIPVAVKKLKSIAVVDLSHQLIDEACLMLKIQHYHLVRTYGVVSSEIELFLVMELMHHGSLSKYIEENKKGDNIFNLFTVEQVMKLGVQIADGMAYLGDKNILHMDLAARNCLLDGNLNVKVSDFGMSRIVERGYYEFRENKPIPYRWMPPEYFTKEKFTAQSDVWSYGILLWEIVNPGKTPYENLENVDDVKEKVSTGHTLSTDIPSWVPPDLAALIAMCWHFLPKHRLPFMSIVPYLLKYTDENFKRQFRNKSFFYRREFNADDNYVAISPDEEAKSGTIDDEEGGDATPSTPLTSPSSPALVSVANRPNSCLGQGESKSLRESISFTRWRQHLSSVRDSLSFSTSFPFVTNQRESPSGNRKNNRSDVLVNNLSKSSSKFNNQRPLDTFACVPVEQKITETSQHTERSGDQ